LWRLRTLKGQDPVLAREVRDLHVIGDKIALEVCEDFLFQSFPEVQEKELGRAKESRVAQDLAVDVQEGGILALSLNQTFDVVRGHSMEKGDAIGPAKPKETAVTKVQHSYLRAHRLIFLERRAKVERQNPSILFSELSPVSLVDLHQWRLFGHKPTITALTGSRNICSFGMMQEVAMRWLA
jgi:hypothetical protein